MAGEHACTMAVHWLTPEHFEAPTGMNEQHAGTHSILYVGSVRVRPGMMNDQFQWEQFGIPNLSTSPILKRIPRPMVWNRCQPSPVFFLRWHFRCFNRRNSSAAERESHECMNVWLNLKLASNLKYSYGYGNTTKKF